MNHKIRKDGPNPHQRNARTRKELDRREFLKLSTIVVGGIGLAAQAGVAHAVARKMGLAPRTARPVGASWTNMATFTAPPLKTVKIGVIGLGARGPGAVTRLAKIADAKIVALCDLFADRVQHTQGILKRSGRPPARSFHGSEHAWKRLCDMELDLVYIATPWRWHTPMAVHALAHGKHAVTEVPAAGTLEECWQLVETAERTGRHCMMLENTCYDFFELATLNMVRQGVFGELVHAEGAYIHDLLGANFNKHGYQGMWRLIQNRDRNGSLYPTHGIGPIAQCLNINRGDRFEYLSSLSCNDFMMTARARTLASKDRFYRPFVSDRYRGQMNTTILRTHRGKSCMIQHDVTSPRPYSRIHLLSGTKGMVQKWPVRRIAFGHGWLSDEKRDALLHKYRHPLTQTIGSLARKVGGHGGMDFIMDYRLIYCLKHGLPLDQNVYDAAAWSAVAPLSELSVANRSSSVEFPDFTRGWWKKTAPLGIVDVDRAKLRVGRTG